jgi:hypothetical protein
MALVTVTPRPQSPPSQGTTSLSRALTDHPSLVDRLIRWLQTSPKILVGILHRAIRAYVLDLGQQHNVGSPLDDTKGPLGDVKGLAVGGALGAPVPEALPRGAWHMGGAPSISGHHWPGRRERLQLRLSSTVSIRQRRLGRCAAVLPLESR